MKDLSQKELFVLGSALLHHARAIGFQDMEPEQERLNNVVQTLIEDPADLDKLLDDTAEMLEDVLLLLETKQQTFTLEELLTN
jgi:prophage DNA circulation protein